MPSLHMSMAMKTATGVEDTTAFTERTGLNAEDSGTALEKIEVVEAGVEAIVTRNIRKYLGEVRHAIGKFIGTLVEAMKQGLLPVDFESRIADTQPKKIVKYMGREGILERFRLQEVIDINVTRQVTYSWIQQLLIRMNILQASVDPAAAH